MQNYLVTFVQLERFSRIIEAPSKELAMSEAVQAFYRGEIEADYSTLDYIEAEDQP